jgi:hypothetical protein
MLLPYGGKAVWDRIGEQRREAFHGFFDVM